MPRHLPSDARLVALAHSGRLFDAYKERADDEKIAVIARLIGQPEKAGSYRRENGPAFEAIRLAATLTALDAAALRVIFRLAAASSRFLWYLDLRHLVRLIERAPATTFHDAELRRLFDKVRRGQWWYRRLDGLEIGHRILTALGEPEALSASRSSLKDASEQVLDAWIDAWVQLVDESSTSGGEIDARMRERSRQAQRIAAAKPEIAWGRSLMNLDDREGEANFRSERLSSGSAQTELRTLDRAWLARLRQQEAAWLELGPMRDWSGSTIPGIKVLAEIRIGAGESLLDFLRAVRAAKPNAKWSTHAAALACGPQGPAIRGAIVDWLGGLAVAGAWATRSRLWRDVAECRNFRWRVLEDVCLLSEVPHDPCGGNPAAAALVAFFDEHAPFKIRPNDRSGFFDAASDPSVLSEAAALLVRAAVWMLACWRDGEAVATLQRTAQLTLMRPAFCWVNPQYRSLLVANACILALGDIATAEAVQALGRMKLAARDERLSKQIAKAIELAARRAGVGASDLEELAVPTFDLEDVGTKAVRLGEFVATLRVESTTAATVALTRADGRRVKTVPATIKGDPAANDELKQLKAAARSIAQALPVHRQRIESLYVTRRTWPLPVWRARFLDHPLVGTLTRRLIWTVTDTRGHARSLMWHAPDLVDAAGAPATRLGDDCVVTLWHPLEATGADVAAWRAFLMRHKLTQPFKQAHRELYPLTDAERLTSTYSNRFAGHILRQHQSVALARTRGWRATFRMSANLPNDEPTHLRIPDFGLAAELWTEPAGDDAELTGLAYPFISADRVRFRKTVDDGSGALGDPVSLDAVPPRIFSEVMRDVDLFVSVASIGNDPSWIDGGADAPHPSRWRDTTARDYWRSHSAAELDVAGQSRKRFLAELIPSLAIADRCTLADRHLTVRGRLRTYRIHLGSGNILMEGDRYLCIVPGSRDDALDIFLPFEGDRMLSIILSKAVMLTADDKITDPAILAQLRK